MFYTNPMPGSSYHAAIAAKNADTLKIKIRSSGTGVIAEKEVRRADLELFQVGTTWHSVDKSVTFTVVAH